MCILHIIFLHGLQEEGSFNSQFQVYDLQRYTRDKTLYRKKNDMCIGSEQPNQLTT